MSQHVYRYEFGPDVPLDQVEAAFVLAVSAAQSLHGDAGVRLDAAHCLDAERRACVIDAGTAIGQDLNRLFVGFIAREFGEDAFRVERVEKPQSHISQEISE